MRIRYLLVILFVFLDVASPFSCVNRSRENYNNKPKVLYCYSENIEYEDGWRLRDVWEEEILLGGNKAGEYTIEEPGEPEKIKNGYRVVKYGLLTGYEDGHEVLQDISFPYVTNQKDFQGYFRGIRTVVVIYAIVEPIE